MAFAELGKALVFCEAKKPAAPLPMLPIHIVDFAAERGRVMTGEVWAPRRSNDFDAVPDWDNGADKRKPEECGYRELL